MSTKSQHFVIDDERVAHPSRTWLTVSSNLDPKLGGVSSVMPHLLESVRRAGVFDMSLAAFCTPGEDLSKATSGVNSYRCYALEGLRSLVDGKKARCLDEQILGATGVHIHGIWQEHCALAAQRARALRRPYVISAHGMLDPWALQQKRWKKAAYFQLIEKKSLRSAACLHALTRAEATAYSQLAPGVPIAVVPNGITVPPVADPEDFFRRYPLLRDKQLVLFLGRIHRKKGLDILARAWRTISADYPQAHLVLAGPDSEGGRLATEREIEALRIADKVTFTGMLTGNEKWGALQAARLFVLPSYSEGLSVSVLEAMAMGRPVLITEQCHVDGVQENNCGWQIQPTVRDLESALHDFFALSGHAAASMGENGRCLVRDSYNWTSVGRRMSQLYQWISGGAKPHEVLIET